MTPEEELRLYEEDVNAEENIRRAITDAYGGLKPELETIRAYEAQQFPAFYDAFHGYGAGTSAADLAPSTILENAWRDVAAKSAAAQVARDAFNVRQASMEDLIGRGLNQWQLGYTGAQNAYERWWQQQQAEEEKRRWEEQMALQRAAMARSAASAPGIVIPSPQTSQVDLERAIMDAYRDWNANVWNAGANKARNEQWNAGANAAWEKREKTSPTSTTSTGWKPTNSGYFSTKPPVRTGTSW